MERMPRILLAKLGHGHKDSLLNLAKKLGDAGFEIVYTELDDPEAIVGTAIQESVDHVGITVVEDGNIEDVGKIMSLLREKEEEEITVAVGGLIDESECKRLTQAGVNECFPRGTNYEELIRWARENISGPRRRVQE